MTLDEARKRLFDTAFLLGGMRRRAPIKVLVGSPGAAGVQALATAVGQNHPKPAEILDALGRLSPEADADKVEALWGALASHPTPALAGVLAKLGWPAGRPIGAKTARDVLAAAVEGAAPEVIHVVVAFARALPVADEAATTPSTPPGCVASPTTWSGSSRSGVVSPQPRPWRPCTPWPDEDGLFEQARSLRLIEVLELCERWAATLGRPAHPPHRAAVDRAVGAYRGLGEFKAEPGPELPDGLVDIFGDWRGLKPGDADLRADLATEDPLRKARGLYLGHEQALAGAPGRMPGRPRRPGSGENGPRPLGQRLCPRRGPALGAHRRQPGALCPPQRSAPAGERDSAAIFAKACFGHPSPSKRQKSRGNHCLRRPQPSCVSRPDPTRGRDIVPQ